MSAETELSKAVLNFVKNHHESGGKAPSIRAICREVDGVSVRTFYKLFPGGLGEACRKAGVPAPKKRLRATQAAQNARKKSSRKKAEETQHAEQVDHEGLPLVASWTTLSGAQRDLVQGLHFLEDGKDQSLIIDEILKQRMYLLKNKLSIDDVKTVLDCIESAKKMGFKIPWFLGFLQRLWNAGLFRSDVDAKKIEGMTVFLEKMKERGWRAEEIPDFLSMPFIKFTLPKLSPEQGETLNDLLRRLNLEGLSVDEHMKQVSEARNTLSWYKAVLDGRATMDQFRQAVNQQ